MTLMWNNYLKLATFNTKTENFNVDMFIQGLQTSTMALIIEIFPQKTRAITSASVSFFWGFGVLLLAFVGYFIKNWRYIQLVFTLPFLYSLLFYW